MRHRSMFIGMGVLVAGVLWPHPLSFGGEVGRPDRDVRRIEIGLQITIGSGEASRRVWIGGTIALGGGGAGHPAAGPGPGRGTSAGSWGRGSLSPKQVIEHAHKGIVILSTCRRAALCLVKHVLDEFSRRVRDARPGA